MRVRTHLSFVTAVLCVGLAAFAILPPSAEGARAYTETQDSRGWHLFLRPARSSPSTQLAFAQGLEQTGRLRAAARQYRALVAFWPQTSEAATAQAAYADILDRRGRIKHAFQAYQVLFERYIGEFPYETIHERQFQIARSVMDQRRGRFWFFPGIAAPERAIPLLETVYSNGLESARAPQAQYLIGRAYELSLQIEPALQAYETTITMYLGHPYALRAELARARCLYHLALEAPSDQLHLDEAWAAITVFLNEHPNSELEAEAHEIRGDLYQRRAQAAYRVAHYYDAIERRPQAALRAYQQFVKLFPDSPWTQTATDRIAILSGDAGVQP